MKQKPRNQWFSFPNWITRNFKIKFEVVGDRVNLIIVWGPFGISFDFPLEEVAKLLVDLIGDLKSETAWNLLENQLEHMVDKGLDT